MSIHIIVVELLCNHCLNFSEIDKNSLFSLCTFEMLWKHLSHFLCGVLVVVMTTAKEHWEGILLVICYGIHYSLRDEPKF